MRITYVLLLLSLFFCADLDAQRKKKKKREETPPAPLTMLPPVSDSMFHDLKWRNIGPFRGGRSVTSVGVIGQDGVYYMGSTGGGIFKTTNDGITWTNVSDGFSKREPWGPWPYPNQILTSFWREWENTPPVE
jgi:hypothetical protein